MNILFSEEIMPGQSIIDRIREAASLSVKSQDLDPARIEVSVTFVGPEEIRELNQQFRGVDKVTDVLSFPQYESLEAMPEKGPLCLGDVVICSEQALLQADEFGHSPERELVYLFVHSIFHLMGYDHLEDEDKKSMRDQEEKVMTLLGIER
jgi:probable rRNA maturation factor